MRMDGGLTTDKLFLIVAVLLIRTVRRTHDTLLVVALSFVLAGSIGNLIDRVFRSPGFLRGAVEGDAAAFEHFWRDRTEETLRLATEIPIQIAEHCSALAEIGIELYDRGFKNARGEVGAAALSAVANGEAAAFCAVLVMPPISLGLRIDTPSMVVGTRAPKPPRPAFAESAL